MTRHEYALNPGSCWRKAKNTEQLFVLMGRDQATPDTIRYWARLRLELQRNKPGDLQITQALMIADLIENHRTIRKPPQGVSC